MNKNARGVRTHCCALLAAGATVLALAGPAGARGTGGFTLTYNQGSALMKGTHGYRVQIFAQPGELRSAGASGRVQVSAFKGQRVLLKSEKASKPTLSSSYTATGTVGPKVMKADLGKFGKVDLEFHAQKTTHPTPDGCHGRLTLKKGVWKGTFKFRGEHGYTKASATHIDGQYESGSTTCSGPTGGGGNKKFVVLSASTAQPKANGYSSFEASKRKSGGKPVFSASTSKSAGAIDIYRNAYMTGESGDFTYNAGYTHAKVKGRGPFSGTGNFNGDWTGSLKVKFPGETLGLTSGFVANLGEETFKHPVDRP